MPKVVAIPGVGNVEFPDSMSDQDIAKRAAEAHASAQFEQTRAGFENQPPLSAGRIASEAGKMLISPVTGLLNAARALPDWIGRGMPIEAPMSTPHLPGDNGNPVEEAAGNMAMAVAPPAVEAAKAAGGRLATKAVDVATSPGVIKGLKRSTEGVIVGSAMHGNVPGVAAGTAGRIGAEMLEGFAQRRAALKAKLAAMPPAEMVRQAAPLTAEEEALAQHVMNGVEPQPQPAPAADVAPSAAQIPASASPMQLAPFSPQTVLDYMQERAKPVLAQPSELAKDVAKRPARAAKVVTIPSPEPEFPAETYAASARATKAGKLATLLHEHGIPYEDAKLMGEPEWAQAAQAAGVKVPSGDSVKLALFELKKLGKQGKLSEMNPKAAKIAVDLDKEMNK